MNSVRRCFVDKTEGDWVSNAMQHIIRTLVQGAMGMSPASDVQRVLEDRLFSEIVPASDAGEVPKEAADILLNLYQKLAENEERQGVSLAVALRQLFGITGIPEKDPIGAIGFSLQQVLMGSRLTGSEAEKIAQMPWKAAARAIGGPVANQLTAFVDLLAAFTHEVEEGFVARSEHDARLYEEAEHLSSLLRSFIARPQWDTVRREPL